MKKIFLLVCCLSLCFGLNLDKFECENCQNLKPQNIKKVYASNPTLLYSLYSFDKSLIAGLVFEFWDIEKRFLDPKVYNLPVVGGFYGQGKTPNMEMIISLKPDLIITSKNSKKDPKYSGIFRDLKIPVLYVDDDGSDFGLEIYKAFGEIFGNPKRARELIDYANESQNLASNLQKLNLSKPSVYYAFGKNGLETECGSSSFIRLVDMAGGNSAKFACKGKNARRVKADFENILAKNPDVILVYDKEFYELIWSDPKWQLINAVKNKRVYLIPRSPFSWVGKPASFTKLLGLRWLVEILHKDALQIDIRDEARKFYKLFLYTDLSDEDLDFILNEKD